MINGGTIERAFRRETWTCTHTLEATKARKKSFGGVRGPVGAASVRVVKYAVRGEPSASWYGSTMTSTPRLPANGLGDPPISLVFLVLYSDSCSFQSRT